MHILTALTYYRPYTSGLTVYAERMARAFGPPRPSGDGADLFRMTARCRAWIAWMG